MAELTPALTRTNAVAMVAGTIIGASIFVQPSEICFGVRGAEHAEATLDRIGAQHAPLVVSWSAISSPHRGRAPFATAATGLHALDNPWQESYGPASRGPVRAGGQGVWRGRPECDSGHSVNVDTRLMFAAIL